MFEAVRGSLANGYVAIDYVEFHSDIPLAECPVFPPEAVVKPTDHPPVPLPDCDFEQVEKAPPSAAKGQREACDNTAATT